MHSVLELDPGLMKKRNWFKAAVERRQDWTKKARIDYRFYFGDQWEEADRQALKKQKRPAITINRVRPLINLVSGYQRLNRYEPDFLPRTANDLELCKVRKGITKYIMDSSKYDREESRVFLDSAISGLGWFEVGYTFDHHAMDGKAFIKRASPFDIYLDPECREPDLSDAEYICRAKWVSKADLIRTYPEKQTEIEGFAQRYDKDEDVEEVDFEPLWYSQARKKARLVEIWYKERTMKVYYQVGLGQVVPKEELQPGMTPLRSFRVPQTEIRCAVILADVELEDIPSPYKHGRFPFAPFYAYYLGEEEEDPAGIVRDLQDPQRELNKHRSQLLHLINTMANKGWFLRKGQPLVKKQLETAGSSPGVVIEYDVEQPQQFDTTQIPSSFAALDKQGSEDFKNISGVNEAMMGTEVGSSASGKAIALKQRQAVTQLAGLFDNLRETKELVLQLLWGGPGVPGIVPQYYTEQKTFRIVGENGRQDFVTINQPQFAGYDLLGNAITQTLNDLSVGEFDIVIADTAATPTQRTEQFYALLEMVQKGIQIPPDMIIEASDLPQKEELKRRLQQQQQQAMLMQQQQAMAAQNRASPQPGAPPARSPTQALGAAM